MRKISSYTKVRKIIAALLRNKTFQLFKIKKQNYLNLGCGPYPNQQFINLDYRWFPGVDLVWDIMKKLPFQDNHFYGIFTEHCIEHFNLLQLEQILKELKRILKPKGVLRIVTPDLKKYVNAYHKKSLGDKVENEELLADAQAFNRVFYSGHDLMSGSRWWNDGHHYIHDEESLKKLLEGFLS